MQINQKQKYSIIIAGAILLLILISLFLAYGTDYNIFKNTYPAAIVNGRFVTLKYWTDAKYLAKKFEPNFDSVAVYNQLINTEKKKVLALNFNLINSSDFEAETAFLKAGTDEKFEALLRDYFDNQIQAFNAFVVAPRVYDAKLRIYYNSIRDTGANFDTYAKAKKILLQIDAGQGFDQLAQTQSDDKISGQLDGDLGFVTLDQLLPEIAAKIRGAQIGRVLDQVVVSRWGYHILYPVETAQQEGETVYHVKQILIQTTGFEDWLESQTKDYSVWKITQD